MTKQSTQRAIDQSRAGYTDAAEPKRRTTNPLIAAMRIEHPEWRDPPNEDARLVWRWNVADAECGERSGGWPSGPKNAGEHPAFDESHSAQAKAVGFMDRRSPAARRRETDRHLAALSAFDVGVLKRAYGPEEHSGPNAVHPQTKARLGTLARARIALLTAVAIEGAGTRDERLVERWLRHEADADAVEQAKMGADALLFAAHNRYCDVRGRRRRVERHASEAEVWAEELTMRVPGARDVEQRPITMAEWEKVHRAMLRTKEPPTTVAEFRFFGRHYRKV